jgi:hypothetical protein
MLQHTELNYGKINTEQFCLKEQENVNPCLDILCVIHFTLTINNYVTTNHWPVCKLFQLKWHI